VTARRELTAALALCAIGGVLARVAAARVWVRTDRVCSGDNCLSSSVRGPVAPLAGALALAAIAGVVGILASRGRGRRLVGAVVGALGVGIVVAGLIGVFAPKPGTELPPSLRTANLHATTWPVLGAAGGLAVFLAGLLVAVRGEGWQGLAARYDGPQGASDARVRDPEAALWDALSRGDDPT
jgi:uncharacterized membrane protein (TIGR02234 family)